MFHPNTLFVVGAGASKEVGLPLGGLLVDSISQALHFELSTIGFAVGSGNSTIYNAITEKYFQINRANIFKSCREMSIALKHATSIDAYLDDFRDDDILVTCGKIAIAHIIAHAELSSSMAVDFSNIYNKPPWDNCGNTWYPKFFAMLKEGVGKQDLDTIFDGITIVCFNYDRCIEHYLYYALQNYYRIDPDEAFALIKKLRIIHPYGTIGPFDLDPQTKFGLYLQGANLLAQSAKIRTVFETRNSQIEGIIRGAVQTAEQAIFLGFGFHRLNIELLASPERNQNLKAVYATCYEVPDPVRQVLRMRISEVFSGAAAPEKVLERVILANQTSRQILDNYDLLMMSG